ncbi:MAG: amidohydrolase family protein [Ferroplasma sp.]|uniref:amidohydrolase family protein n=1 Tax=Ferroplasma sp. TaxID=2591003 RepID=UPI0028154300|nr:amidohydrolase family protein [Ferroplasma sp.]WMT51313.1 MAG: amidohydrolase family protein [Ferroplasma sp.]
MSILIKNGTIITENDSREIVHANILVDGNKIAYIGREQPEHDSEINAEGKFILPGFINTHTHIGMSGFRGLLDNIVLSEFLDKTSKLDADRTEEGIYNSSLLGIKEMLNSGITSFVDLYYSEDVIEKAVEKTGIRGFLAWATLDQEFTTQKGDPVKNAEAFIRKTHPGTVTPMAGIQGIYVSSDENYYRVRDLSEKYNVMVHTHLSETRKEVYDFVKSHNERPVEHLASIGFLSDKLLAAHCVWITLNEIKLLAKNGTAVSWNAISNAKLASGGIAPIPELLSNNVNVSLGTDSSGSNNSLNMFEEMKYSAISINNDRWSADTVKSQQILDMATRNAGVALKAPIGIIKEGYLADLVIINPNRYSTIPYSNKNIVNNIVFSASSENVEYVMVDGKTVLNRNGENEDSTDYSKLNYL